MKVAVLMGGTSSEREVSLKSGAAVVEALRQSGQNEIVPVVLDADNLDALPEGIQSVFLALHGGYGENGGVQADLDKRRIPYTGPGAAASRITMDKVATKQRLEAAGVRTAPYEVLERGMDATTMELPLVVKPPADGSSVGVSKVTEAGQWAEALRLARLPDPEGRALVERYIPGREWTVSVLDGEALPVIEIQARDGWYGFAEKYTHGLTNYVFPEAEADKPLLARAQKLAVEAFHAVGCRGVSRVDFRVSPEGVPYVLEINTIPGFTETSLLPKAAGRAGYTFPQLCEKLLSLAKYGA
ncbi:MAG: D-alanine--D-alanine ligase [Kiritimatiellae bacterium]|nr:D-alanine--D-alanine ligase [Kiritimatiellia bacterium]